MHMDSAMPQLVGTTLLILLVGLILKLARQPHVIAYIITGVLIGPWGLGLITDFDTIARLGAIGVILLLFFVGMETDPAKLLSNWKLACFGTLLQVCLSLLCAWLISLFFEWSFSRTLLIGFVISLSSTAIVIRLLEESGLLASKVGQGVLSILLAQDLAIIPMLILIGMTGDQPTDGISLFKQGVGTLITGALFAYLLYRKQIQLPLSRVLKEDRELQLFAALSLCFGLALITGWFELSTALGAFVGGMLVGVARETQWVHHTLESFKILLLALFFISVGMLLDLVYLLEHLPQVILLTLAALVTNTFINALILRTTHFSWHDSLYAGLLLAQIGEFSFVLAAVGLQAGIINSNGYQLVLCVISMSLLLSPGWIANGKRLINARFDQ